MPVRVQLPGPLRPYASGLASVALPDVTTVGEAIDLLGARYPGILHRLMNEQRQVREHVNIFVGEESIRATGGLATPLHDGDEMVIIPAISGGTLW